MNNTGIHHISSLVGNIYQAYDFYHGVLGLNLVLKTVNQEDSSMYHLFFGDERGRVGTEFTIFDMLHSPARRPGTNALERTIFLVKSQQALDFWEHRLGSLSIPYQRVEVAGQQSILLFEDEDKQPLGISYQAEDRTFYPVQTASIPEDYAIVGIAGLQMRIRDLEELEEMVIHYFGFEFDSQFIFQEKVVRRYRFPNEFQHFIDLIIDREAPISVMGVGSIHHIAFGVEDRSDLEDLITKLNLIRRHHTGIINRDFMHSLYYRAPNYLMFEVATATGHREAPIPQQKELLDQIPLFLPSFLEEDRADIESSLAERYI
ncbi:TPA: VOC family protein [Streptococcus suis]